MIINKDIKIIDFGYSVMWEPEDQLSVFWGTTPYMAPEIVQKEKYWGHHVDVWAIGVITYAMLAGNMPFNGKTEEDLFKKISWGQYREPNGVSFDCKRLLSQIFTLDPMKRPTVSDLFYDSWNCGYFSKIVKNKRKNKNSSAARLVNKYAQIQQMDNCFAFTEKKKMFSRPVHKVK